MSVQPIPEGYQAVTPYLVVKDVAALIDFLERAFDARVVYRMDTPNGTMHAEVKLRDSMIMMGQAQGEQKPCPAMLYLYVEDADAVYEKAVSAGGTSIQEPTDQFYGDRSGAVRDSNDNQWWIATRKENLSHEELSRRAIEARKEKVQA